MTVDNEKEPKTKIGCAFIARFVDEGIPDEFSEFVYLVPGEAVIFQIGGGMDKFAQNELVAGLNRAAERGNFEALAVCDINTGGVLLSRGPDESYGVGPGVPKDKLSFIASYGQSKYVVIWRETVGEVKKVVASLIKSRTHRN